MTAPMVEVAANMGSTTMVVFTEPSMRHSSTKSEGSGGGWFSGCMGGPGGFFLGI